MKSFERDGTPNWHQEKTCFLLAVEEKKCFLLAASLGFVFIYMMLLSFYYKEGAIQLMQWNTM